MHPMITLVYDAQGDHLLHHAGCGFFLLHPYRSITNFMVETAGHFELDADLKIWISGNPIPIEKTFRKDKSIFDIQKSLATYVLR